MIQLESLYLYGHKNFKLGIMPCHLFMWKADEKREIISSALVMPIPTSAQNYEPLESLKENSFPVLDRIFLTQCFHVEYGDELQECSALLVLVVVYFLLKELTENQIRKLNKKR